MEKKELRETETEFLVEILHLTTGRNPTIFSPSCDPPEPFWHNFAALKEEIENNYPETESKDVISKVIDKLQESAEIVSEKWYEDFSKQEMEKTIDLMWASSIEIFNYLVGYLGKKEAISIFLRAISERVIGPYQTEIDIQSIPSKIKVDLNQVKENQCFKNSFDVALNNNDVAIVEGIIFLKTNELTSKIIAHVWNRLDENNHFDVTRDAIFKDHPEIDSIKYFPGLVYYANEVNRIPEWKFTNLTEVIASDLNSKLE